jgi:polyisoprenoid-binding protein YceI
MARWVFEPGHTAAEFRVRHMMVTWVRGHFKGVEGWIEIDFEDLSRSRAEATVPAANVWTGVPERDEHLRSADFLDVENHPTIAFRSGEGGERSGENEVRIRGDLTVRGVTRPVDLDVRYLGQWGTPYWVDGRNLGSMKRAGFLATTSFNRHDFGVSWNDEVDRGGVVVGSDVHVTIDVEAILESDLQRLGAG